MRQRRVQSLEPFLFYLHACVLPTTILLTFTMSSAEHTSPNTSPKPPSIAIGKLPPLPEIRSRWIRKRVFTHSSLAGENRYDFQAPQSDPSTDNEE